MTITLAEYYRTVNDLKDVIHALRAKKGELRQMLSRLLDELAGEALEESSGEIVMTAARQSTVQEARALLEPHDANAG